MSALVLLVLLLLWLQCDAPDSLATMWVQCDVPDLNRDAVSSVWRAGPQPRSCEFSVACRTSTAILWVQCGVPDLNRDPVSSVWRAGPQPRSCEFSVACRTSTAILWVQCGVPDLNRDPVRSVWRAGPQPRSESMSEDKSERMSEDMSERSSERMSEKGCQKECSKICQKECQKEVGRTRSSGRHNKYDVWLATFTIASLVCCAFVEKAICVSRSSFMLLLGKELSCHVQNFKSAWEIPGKIQYTRHCLSVFVNDCLFWTTVLFWTHRWKKRNLRCCLRLRRGGGLDAENKA